MRDSRTKRVEEATRRKAKKTRAISAIDMYCRTGAENTHGRAARIGAGSDETPLRWRAMTMRGGWLASTIGRRYTYIRIGPRPYNNCRGSRGSAALFWLPLFLEGFVVVLVFPTTTTLYSTTFSRTTTSFYFDESHFLSRRWHHTQKLGFRPTAIRSP